MSTVKIIVGYKTKLTPGLENNLPEFKAPSHWKDDKKIAESVETQKGEFLASARAIPYVSTFEQVILADPGTAGTKAKVLPFTAKVGDDEKLPVSVRVRNYLVKTYPDAWSDDVGDRRPPSVVFVGFGMRTFLKIMGLECSLPANEKRCPVGLWYGNSDHRDIADAVMPKEDCKGLNLKYVLRLRRPIVPADAAIWDGYMQNWAGPGQDPATDIRIAATLAEQLGLLT